MSRLFNPRHQITIQQLSNVKGTSGGRTKSWSNFGVGIWAEIRNPSGNERRATAHGGEVAEARTEFVIRYLAGVVVSMRVTHNGAYYDIKHVNNLREENQWMILTCDTGVNDG